jgi:hypothetical protein
MPNTELAHVFVNFSKRKIDKEVQWKWDFEGAAGFAETISELGHILDPEMVTYLFAEQ